jgi:AraC family transcriptional regulator
MHTDIIFPNITSTLQITGCHFGKKPPGWDYPKHHHHLYEILYCQKGEAQLVVNGEELLLFPGDWLFLRAGARHELRNHSDVDDSFSFFNIHFDIDDPEIRRNLSTSGHTLLSASVTAATKLPDYASEIERMMHQRLLQSPLRAAETERRLHLAPDQKVALQAYILLIIQEIILLQASEQSLVPKRTPDTTIHEADTAHLIEEQLRRLITTDGSIAQIAEALNMSRSQCTKVFTKIYAISPVNTLRS